MFFHVFALTQAAGNVKSDGMQAPVRVVIANRMPAVLEHSNCDVSS